MYPQRRHFHTPTIICLHEQREKNNNLKLTRRQLRQKSQKEKQHSKRHKTQLRQNSRITVMICQLIKLLIFVLKSFNLKCCLIYCLQKKDTTIGLYWVSGNKRIGYNIHTMWLGYGNCDRLLNVQNVILPYEVVEYFSWVEIFDIHFSRVGLGTKFTDFRNYSSWLVLKSFEETSPNR